MTLIVSLGAFTNRTVQVEGFESYSPNLKEKTTPSVGKALSLRCYPPKCNKTAATPGILNEGHLATWDREHRETGFSNNSKHSADPLQKLPR